MILCYQSLNLFLTEFAGCGADPHPSSGHKRHIHEAALTQESGNDSLKQRETRGLKPHSQTEVLGTFLLGGAC